MTQTWPPSPRATEVSPCLSLDLPSLLFEFSNFKPVKDNILVRSDMMSVEERQRFELIIQKILEFKYPMILTQQSLRPAKEG